MQNFGTALSVARKNAGLTQDQLASQMNITRQALSHWENGRTMPDEATILRLEEVLSAHLMEAARADEAEAARNPLPEGMVSPDCPEEKDPVPQPAPVEPMPGKRSGWWRYVLCALAGAAIASAVFLLLPGKTGTVAGTPAPVYTRVPAAEDATLKWYSEAAGTAPVDGMPYVTLLSLENPVKLVRSDEAPEGLAWFYAVQITEQSGYDFNMTSLVQHYFSNGKDVAQDTIDGQQLAEFYGSNVLSARGTVLFDGGLPAQDLDGIGFELTGTDASGSELSFYGYLEFSKEVAESVADSTSTDNASTDSNQ